MAVEPSGESGIGIRSGIGEARVQPAPLPGRPATRALPAPGSVRPPSQHGRRRLGVIAAAVLAGLAGILLWSVFRQRTAQIPSDRSAAIAAGAPVPLVAIGREASPRSSTLAGGASGSSSLASAADPAASPARASVEPTGPRRLKERGAGTVAGHRSSQHSAASQPLPLEHASTAAEQRLRREVATARDEVRSGIARIQSDLEGGEGDREQRLKECRERLEALISRAAAHPQELAGELARLRLLDKSIATALIEARSAVRETSLARAAWQRRTGEIEKLIADRSYPEAKRLAESLAAEPGVPSEVAARARELAAQAERELKRIFGKGGFGSESNQLQPKPPS